MVRKIKRHKIKQPKMSDILIEFAQPLLDTLPPNAAAAEWESCLLTAGAVWNGTVSNNEARVIFEVEQIIGTSLDTRRILDMFFDRKRRLFANDTRLIVDIHAQDTPTGVYVTAASVSSK
jgi:hypothetical protein